MTKDNLETKARKAVLRIEDKVTDIDNVLRDVSMKLCYIVEKNKNSYTMSNEDEYRM